MYIPEKMKVNKFVQCAIPSNRDYFTRFGLNVTPETQYTGDEVAPKQMNTAESIEDYKRYAESMENTNNDE